MVAWMIAIGISVAALIISAASRPGNLSMAYTHLAIAACVSIFFAFDGIRKVHALSSSNGSPSAIAAEGVRAGGLVWIWAGLVIAVTYGTGVLAWKEWPAHFVGMFIGAGVCLAVASSLSKTALAKTEDPTMMSIARILLIVQLVAMLLLIVGFLLDGQMKRFLVERFTDWPAKNVMFFGALAIAALSGATLKLLPRTSK